MPDTAQKRLRLQLAEQFLRTHTDRRRAVVPLIVRAMSQGVLICWGCKKNWTHKPEKMAIIEPLYWRRNRLTFVICHECVANGIDADHARADFYRRLPKLPGGLV